MGDGHGIAICIHLFELGDVMAIGEVHCTALRCFAMHGCFKFTDHDPLNIFTLCQRSFIDHTMIAIAMVLRIRRHCIRQHGWQRAGNFACRLHSSD